MSSVSFGTAQGDNKYRSIALQFGWWNSSMLCKKDSGCSQGAYIHNCYTKFPHTYRQNGNWAGNKAWLHYAHVFLLWHAATKTTDLHIRACTLACRRTRQEAPPRSAHNRWSRNRLERQLEQADERNIYIYIKENSESKCDNSLAVLVWIEDKQEKPSRWVASLINNYEYMSLRNGIFLAAKSTQTQTNVQPVGQPTETQPYRNS